MSIEVELPDGNTLVFPDGTDKSVIEQTARRAIENPHSLKSTKELEAVPSAPSTFRDINESAAMSLAGGIKGLSDIFGVNNAVSKKMEELQKEAYGRLTPERKRELAIEDELARRASEEGFLAEAKQAGKSFLRSPLQQGVGAAFSSVPIIAATALAPEVTIPAALAGRAGIGALAARTAIANAPAIGVGTAMGVGSQKGQDYAAVKQAMLEKGATEEEAEAAAQKAAEYSLQNLPRQAASGVAGGLEGALGVESLLGRAGRARAGVRGGPEAPTWGQAVGQSTFGEAIPEAIQSGVGAVGSNIAQQQAGLDTDTFKGVAGEMTSGALAAALLGTAVSPLQMRQLRQEFARDQLEKQLEEQKQKFEEYQKKQAEIAKTKENLGTQTTLSLPAPAPKVEEKDPLQNPLGNLTKDELGPEVVGYIEQYRTKNGMPLLNSYSIEDVKDAMTQVNPAGEAAALDSLVAAKSGYQPDVNYSAQDVLNAATNKVDTTTQGFRDFLNRTTGSSDLDTMSQPQLYAAFKALEAVPVGQGLTILPEGSNASRFTEIQMVQGLDAIAAELGKNQALTPEQTITKVKEATGLKNDRDAASLIKQLVKDNNLDTNADGNIIAPTEIKNLPAGYTLEKGTFKQSDQQLYGVLSDGKPLEGVDTYTNPQDAQAKVDALNKTREKQAKAVEQTIQKIQDQIDQSQQNLDAMEAAGEGGTNEYKQAKAKHDALVSNVTDNINDLQARQMMFQTPLTMGPMGMKQVNRTGFTLFKDGVPVSTHPTADAAIDSLVGTLPDAEVEALAQDKTPGMRTVARKARQRIEQKNQPAKTEKKPVAIKEAPAGKVTEEDVKEAQSLAKTLGPILKKFGLGNIELQIIKGMEDEGSYVANLIRISMGLKDPIGVLYHESIHALKDLGFFTDAQWNALVRMANDKWVDQYLRNVRHDDTRSRFDAYKEQFEDEANKKGLTGKDADNYVQNAIIEEAIADAFRGFGRKPPPGMLTAILNKIKEFFARLKDALNMAGYETAEDIFGRIEQGRLKPAKGDKPNDWKANKADLRKAEEYYDENGIMPYTSEGQLDVPLESDGTKFSIKSPYTEAQAKGRIKKTREGKEVRIAPKFNDPVTGLPLNSKGTVTLYYPTTNEGAREMARVKRLRGHSPEATRIYLTNESSAAEIEKKPGAIDQPVGGANVLLQVDPAWLQVAQEYDNGRKDFYIPIAEGQYFAHKAKMTKMFTLFASRKKGLHPDRKLAEVALAIESTVDKWKAADKKQRDQMFKDAKDVLNQQHNVSNLFGANAKLEKTNIGEYGLTYEGKKVISTGLGFASAQKISDKAQETTCPKSAICEDLCLGETSGQNELYGGEGPHRSGPRLSQFLKTEAFIVNPEAFTTSLIRQIERFRAEAKKVDYYPSIRLNVTSDFPGKMFKPIMDMFPDVKFYDYTKLVTAKPVAGNHHLTYSSTGASQVVKGETIVNKESNWDQLVDKVLPNGMNVAMAFTSRTSMPKAIYDERTDQTFEVWNGDEYDARFLDPEREDGKGWIIGLTNKDRTTAPENAAKERDGFFLDYDPERDGDTLTIKNQNKLAGKPEKKVFPIAKMSLRAPNTKEFKQWFDDSKIVDEDGTPIIMYHGTYQETEEGGMTVPRTRGKRNAFFVSPDPNFASKYALNDLDWFPGKKGFGPIQEGAHIYPVYIYAKKPFDYENDAHMNLVIPQFKRLMKTEEGFSASEIDDIISDFREGRWSAIEFANDLDLFELNGFDAFYTKEQGRKNLGVFKPQQIKSAIGNKGTYSSESPDIRKSLRSGSAVNAFSPSEIEKESEVGYKSRDKLIDMNIDDFLSLAQTGFVASKQEAADKRVAEGTPFTSIPYLRAYPAEEGSTTYKVAGHEGRHRARALKKAGYTTMPVLFTTDIRFSEQNDPDKFDYKENWPEKLEAQEGASNPNFSIDFPVSREESRQSYQPAEKKSLRSTAPQGIPQNIWDLHEKLNLADDEAMGRVAITTERGKSPGALKRNQTMAFRRLNKAVLDFVGGDEQKSLDLMVKMNEESNRREAEGEDIRKSLRAPDTKEFKQFFGRSKIVNRDGTPKVMYHGLAKDTEDFTRKTARGAPIFLTDDPKFAAGFATDSYLQVAAHPEQYLTREQLADGEKKAIAAIRKDYKRNTLGQEMIASIREGAPTADARDYLMKEYVNMLPAGPHIMPLYVRAENPFDYDNASHVRSIVNWLKNEVGLSYIVVDKGFVKINDLAKVLKEGDWHTIESEDIQSAIKELDFDSFYVKEHGRKNLAVYQPTQVKSAIGNEGTYDITNPNVRKSLRAPDTKEFNDWFSDSKAVNKEGEAQVVYAGPARDVTEFEAGEPILTSPDPDVAALYSAKNIDKLLENAAAEMTDDQKEQAKADALALVEEEYADLDKKAANYKRRLEVKRDLIEDIKRRAFTKRPVSPKAARIIASAARAYMPVGENVMPVFLRTNKPFDYENDNHVEMVYDYIQKNVDFNSNVSEQAKEEARKLGVPSEFPEKKTQNVKSHLTQGLKKRIVDDKNVQRAIRSLGFDGFYFKDQGTKNLGVFSSVQVKSATGNIGTYGLNEPDIRKSLRSKGPDVPESLQRVVNEKVAVRDEESWLKRLMSAIVPSESDAFRQAVFNRYQRIGTKEKKAAQKDSLDQYTADVSAEFAALHSDYAAELMASAMGAHDGKGGIPVFRNGVTMIWNDNGNITGPLDIFQPLAKLGDKAFQHWQFWKSAQRGERLDRVNGKPTQFGKDDLQAAKELEALYPPGLFQEVDKAWDKYNRGLVNYMIDTGVISRGMGEEWMKHSDYFPFYRQQMDEDAKGPKMFSAISGVKAPKELKGGDITVGDFFENIIRNTQSAIEAGMKNVAAERAIRNELSLGDAKEIVGFKGEPKRPQSMTNVVTVLRNGETHYYECRDKLFVEAMKGLNMAEIPGLWLFSAPANLLRSFVTKTPDFILANLLRDSMSAWVTSGANITPIIDTAKGFGAAMAGTDPDMQMLYNFGLIGGHEFSGKARESGRTLAKRMRKQAGVKTKGEQLLTPVTAVWEALEKGSTASDAATRLAVYKNVLEETGNQAEALKRAMEIMNFQRKGNSALMRILAAAVPFLNARIQGLDVFYRAGIKPFVDPSNASEYEKQVAKAFIKRGSLMMAMSVLYYMMVRDDEDYLAQEEEVRDNNWIIPGLGVKIPIPFEVGIVFKTIPERITALMLGNDTGAQFMDSMARNVQSTFGLQLPQAVLPVIEVATGYSFYTHRQITPQGLGDVNKEYQVAPGTSRLAEVIGQFTSFTTAAGKSFGLSPIEIDHLIKGYTGTMGTYFVDAADVLINANSDIKSPSKRFEQMPFIRRFALDPDARGNVTAYYELKNAVDEVVRTSNLLERTGRVENLVEYQIENMPMLASKDYVNDLYKTMKEFNDMKRQIRSSPLDPDDKRDMIRAVEQMENALTSQIKEYRKLIAQ